MSRPLMLHIKVDDKGNPVLADMNANITKMNKKTKGLGRTLTHVFGSAVMLQGLAKFRQSLVFANREVLEFNKIFKQTEGITGTSGKALDDLKQKVLNVSNVTEHTSSSLAQATLNISKMGFTIAESLAVIPHVANLATSSVGELEEITKLSVQTMKSFQLQATDMEHIVNVIQGTVSSTAIDVADFGESMKFIAPIAKTMNVTLEETAAMIGILGDIGIKGSLGGTTLKNMFLNILKPSDKVRKVIAGMNAEGLSFNKILKEMERSGVGVKDFLETFNKRAVAGSLALSQLTAKTAALQLVLEEDGIKVVDVANKIREAWIPQMEILRNTFVNTFVVMGEILDRSDIGLGIEGITNEFIRLQEWLQKNPEALIRFAEDVANIVKLVGVSFTKAVVFLAKNLDKLRLIFKGLVALNISSQFFKAAAAIKVTTAATTGLVSNMVGLSAALPIIGQATVAIWALGEAMEFLADKSIDARKAQISASFGTKEGEILKQIEAVKELHRGVTNVNLAYTGLGQGISETVTRQLGPNTVDTVTKLLTKEEALRDVVVDVAKAFGMTEEFITSTSKNTAIHLDVLVKKLASVRKHADDIKKINKSGVFKLDIDDPKKKKTKKKEWWEEQFEFLQASARLTESISKSLKQGVSHLTVLSAYKGQLSGAGVSFGLGSDLRLKGQPGEEAGVVSGATLMSRNLSLISSQKQISTFKQVNQDLLAINLDRVSKQIESNQDVFKKFDEDSKDWVLTAKDDITELSTFLANSRLKDIEAERLRLEELRDFRRDQFDQYAEAAMMQVDMVQMIQEAGFAKTKERMDRELLAFEEKSKRELNAVKNNAFKTQIVEKRQFKNKQKLMDDQEKLEKDQLNKRRIWSMVEVAINTAVGVSAALRGTPPASYIMAALTAAMGVAQLALISSQDSYQGGGFTGRGSDSDVAGTVHKNEFVVDADKTRLLGGPEGIDEMINNRLENTIGGGGGLTVIIEGNVIGQEEYVRVLAGEINREVRRHEVF